MVSLQCGSACASLNLSSETKSGNRDDKNIFWKGQRTLETGQLLHPFWHGSVSSL